MTELPGKSYAMGRPKPMCVYCGSREGTTVDHVVPRCLFLPPLPGNMVTVPACPECNASKSKDDDYLRDMLVIDLENDTHPLAHGEMKGKVIRSIEKNRSVMVRDGRRTRCPTPFHSPGGIYLGTADAITIEEDRTNRMFERIVRGLYFHFSRGKRLPTDCTFEVGKINPLAKERTAKKFDRRGAGKYAIGDTFDCVYIVVKDYETVSMWLLQFLNVLVLVATNVGKPRPAPKP